MIDFCILGSGISGSTIANLLSKIAEDETVDSYIRETAQAALTRMAASKVKTRY